MESLRGVIFAFAGGVMGTLAVSTCVGGCGGGTEGTETDSGLDVTFDAPVDTTQDTTPDTRESGGPDVAPDTPADTRSEADVTVDVTGDTTGDAIDAQDGNMADAEAGNADADTGTGEEAAIDGAIEADAEMMDADASTDGDAEAGPNAIQQYAMQQAQAYCQGQAKCCAGGVSGFNVTACAQAYYTGGWRSWLPGTAAAYTAGNLNLNASQANTCISALQNFTCGTLTTSQFATYISACNDVLTGTIATGTGGCVSSFECSNGYCNMALDGGAGTGVCTAFVGDGGACKAGGDSPDQMCAQAGNQAGANRLWCNLTFSTDGGGTCQPPLADTVNCYNATAGTWDDYGCASLLCGDPGTCGGTVTAYPDPGWCATYAAGGG